MKRNNAIAFCGGGTAGHVFPALAVIEALQGRWQGRVFWIGSRTGMERSLISREGLPFYGIPSGKWRRYFSFRNLVDLFKILGGLVSSLAVLIREKPLLLFSKGGYVSVPPVLAARILGIPVWTHESDFDPGLATRIIAPFAETIFVSFPETQGFFGARDREKIVVSGNPVRSGFRTADSVQGRRYLGLGEKGKILLILGGSQGAKSINRMVGDILGRLTGTWIVVHQTGGVDTLPEGREAYHPVEFLDKEMPHVMAAADLVVCRAGAATLAELACLGKAAILLPLGREGSRGDQLRNSAYFEDRKAVLVLREAGPDALFHAIDELSRDRERRDGMAREMGRLSRPEAAAEIARLMLRRTA